MTSDAPWWRDAVLYQVYPRSFADSDGDGVGDLAGVTAHLDHLEWLGVDTIWLTPISPSPNADWGYDVRDYCDVDPGLGTLADLDRLVAAAGTRGMRVVLDLVPNHTSIEHPWFVEARASRDAPHRDWYVWADPGPDGGPPNNWVSTFAGSAWELDAVTGQYYLHNFLAEQPDLNWWNGEVRDEFERILRFWFDRGVAGFRVDAAHLIVKDALLRDNPSTDDGDHWFDRARGQRQVHNALQPETHAVFRRWRAIADGYDPPRLLLGETHVFDLGAVASFYGDGDELALAFNFPFVHADLDATALRRIVAETEALLPPDAWPVWTSSNHDKSRFPTRWCHGDRALAKCALTLLLTLRGTPVLYYGDELAMPDTAVPDDQLRDPVTIASHRAVDRDAARTPMPWRRGPGAGFTMPGVRPWLPFGDVDACNVADQRSDRGSTLQLVRALLALRRDVADLRSGEYRDVTGADDGDVWSFRRGAGVHVVLNLGEAPARVDLVHGSARVAIATDRRDEGASRRGSIEVAAHRGLVLVAEG